MSEQMALHLEPPSRPLPPVVDARVPRSEKRRLAGMSAEILARLQRGPVSNRELAEMFAPGAAWRTRVSDCRKWLESHRGQTVTHEDCGDGLYLYRIEEVR